MSPGWQNTQITDGSQLSGTKVRIHFYETLSATEGFSPPVSFLTPPPSRGRRPPIRSHLLSSRPLVFSRRAAAPRHARSPCARLFFIIFFPLHSTSRRRLLFEPPLLQIGTNPSARLAVFAVKSTWSLSLNPQVPNTWLWWIWTCDWELCFAQKVAGKRKEGGRGEQRGSEGEKTFIATEHEAHLSDAWHSDRWWKSHFMPQTWCTFEILVLIDLLGCLSHPMCHDDNVMCEPRPWGFDE